MGRAAHFQDIFQNRVSRDSEKCQAVAGGDRPVCPGLGPLAAVVRIPRPRPQQRSRPAQNVRSEGFLSVSSLGLISAQTKQSALIVIGLHQVSWIFCTQQFALTHALAK